MADDYKDTPADSFQATPDDAWVPAEIATETESPLSSSTKVVVRFVSPATGGAVNLGSGAVYVQAIKRPLQ